MSLWLFTLISRVGCWPIANSRFRSLSYEWFKPTTWFVESQNLRWLRKLEKMTPPYLQSSGSPRLWSVVGRRRAAYLAGNLPT